MHLPRVDAELIRTQFTPRPGPHEIAGVFQLVNRLKRRGAARSGSRHRPGTYQQDQHTHGARPTEEGNRQDVHATRDRRRTRQPVSSVKIKSHFFGTKERARA